jgi:hypothetical protein
MLNEQFSDRRSPKLSHGCSPYMYYTKVQLAGRVAPHYLQALVVEGQDRVCGRFVIYHI